MTSAPSNPVEQAPVATATPAMEKPDAVAEATTKSAAPNADGDNVPDAVPVVADEPDSAHVEKNDDASTENGTTPKRIRLSHPNIVDGWFKETPTMWPGQAMCLEVDTILHVERSQYQDVLVFRSKTYGNVLVLDGVIQVTERDEAAYQEMIAHLPLHAHPNPRKVLVIGGGDGGVLREVVKHPSVEQVTLCELDEAVPRVSRQYLPKLAAGLDHPKVTLHLGDGAEFLRGRKGEFDVVITDSSDPVGPAATLFEDSFFGLVHAALAPEGILCSQGECMWLHLDVIARVLGVTRSLFPSSAYAAVSMPTYPCGTIGFILASKEVGKKLDEPCRVLSSEEEANLYRYYNADLHRAAFQLPTFVRKAIAPKAREPEQADK